MFYNDFGYSARSKRGLVMPGFFDVIFGSSPAEPAEPKPKKVKKVKDDNTLIKKLEAEIIELRGMITKPKSASKPEPEIEIDEPDA